MINLYRVTPNGISGYETYMICEPLTNIEKRAVDKICKDFGDKFLKAIGNHKKRPDFNKMVIDKINDAIHKPIVFTTIAKDFRY